MKIILASESPRRQELLKQIGLEFDIISSDIEETVNQNQKPEKLVQQLSYLKAEDVAQKVKNESLIIAADTIVVYKNEILGKPKDEQDAYKMLKKLSGNIHEVFTGFTIINNYTNKIVSDYEKTLVKFRELSEEEIKGYIKTQEPMDKAGAYGIQKIGSLLVEEIKGDYFNVVGLPLCKLALVLKREFNLQVLGNYKA